MSCASTQLDLSKELDGHDYLEGLDNNKYSGAIFGDKNTTEKPVKREQFEFYPGTGEFFNLEAAKVNKPAVSEEGEITLNFEGDPLQGVINLLLGEVLKENYVIAPGIAGSVTFATVKPINKNQVLPILEMLLSWNGAALVLIEDRYHIMPSAQAVKGNLTPEFGKIDARTGYTVMVVPLEYIAPTEMEKVLQPYAKEGAIVKVDNARNLIFLAGTKRELSTYMDTISIFDVDWLEGMSTGVFTLEKVEAATVVGELEAIFGEGAENPLAGMFRFMPLERLNAIMVITPQKKYLNKAKEWIMRLDRADSETSINLYVYNVKNIKADDLAGYLNDVFGGGGSSSSTRRQNSGSVAPGATGREIGSTGSASSNITNARSSNNRNQNRGPNTEGISITPIEENNQLLINANAQQYESIMAAVNRLDIEPLQVLIEAKIIEVSLNEETRFGVQWAFGDARGETDSDGGETTNPQGARPNNRGNNFGGFRDTQSAFLGGVSEGRPNSLSYVLTGVDVTTAISALDSDGNVTVLSTPSLLVLNNKEATINVGNEIPVVTNSFSGIGNGNGGNIGSNSVSFRQTGITLEVKPRINPGGLVYLEINQQVSTPGEPEAISQNRPIQNREINTEIAIQSGQTIVMGGLIEENRTKGYSGVPVLGRIPLLGNLFSNRSNQVERTELLVLITPTVIQNPEQAKQLTKEYANQFKGLKPFSKKNNDKEEELESNEDE